MSLKTLLLMMTGGCLALLILVAVTLFIAGGSKAPAPPLDLTRVTTSAGLTVDVLFVDGAEYIVVRNPPPPPRVWESARSSEGSTFDEQVPG